MTRKRERVSLSFAAQDTKIMEDQREDIGSFAFIYFSFDGGGVQGTIPCQTGIN